MYWKMFKADEADGKPFRLHLVADMDDFNAGIGTSYGCVEQQDLNHTWLQRRTCLKFTAVINDTGQEIDVPDLETGMAVLMMNVKGNQSG